MTTTTPVPGMRAVLGSVASLLVGVGFLSAAAGALLTILGLRLTGTTSTALVGVVMSAYFIGLLLGSLTCARLIDRVGHIRAHAVFAATAALVTLLHIYDESVLTWTVLRVVTGYCMAGLFMTAESWLNDKATNATRGRVMSVYLITSSGCFGLGPLAVNLGKPGGYQLFVFVAVLFNLALLPVSLTRTGNPRLEARSRFGLRQLIAASPLGVFGCAVEGLVNGAIYGMGAVYAKSIGLADGEVSLFFSSMLFGALVLLFPIGTLSDRFDRRKVLLALALAGVAGAVLIGVFGARDYRLLLGLAFLVGGLTSPIYGLSVAQTNDYVKREDFTAAAGGLLLAYSIGASIGPAAAAGAMSAIGPIGLWAYVVVVLALLAGFTIYRMSKRSARPVREQSLFVAMAETTPAAVQLDPRAESDDHPESADPDAPGPR